jgi:hypothetical protein
MHKWAILALLAFGLEGCVPPCEDCGGGYYEPSDDGGYRDHDRYGDRDHGNRDHGDRDHGDRDRGGHGGDGHGNGGHHGGDRDKRHGDHDRDRDHGGD